MMSHFVKNLGILGGRNNSGQEREVPLLSRAVACACVRIPIADVRTDV